MVENINKMAFGPEVHDLHDVCTLRSYQVAKAARRYRTEHLAIAVAEGAATGAPGFAGIPFNLVASTFLYYRAVQSVALFYGYDVKNEPEELIIAGEVFASAMAPGADASGAMGDMIAKIMVQAEVAAVKQTVKKGWQAMAEAGGVRLLLVQLRAMANAAAAKALNKAGAKGLENQAFKTVFEQVGRKLTQKAISRFVPVVGAAFGAAFDAGQMATILEYADIFYHKRFILEKEERLREYYGDAPIEIAEVMVE